MKYCSIEGCNKHHDSHGYCPKHLYYLKKYGNPLAVGIRANSHKATNTTEYFIWCGIKARCLNPNSHAYEDYGGRGILIADEWIHDFSLFLKHVGSNPIF